MALPVTNGTQYQHVTQMTISVDMIVASRAPHSKSTLLTKGHLGHDAGLQRHAQERHTGAELLSGLTQLLVPNESVPKARNSSGAALKATLLRLVAAPPRARSACDTTSSTGSTALHANACNVCNRH